jgi:hypothetical protein
MYEYGTLKSVKVIIRRGRKKRENSGRDMYMEMSQRNPMYN